MQRQKLLKKWKKQFGERKKGKLNLTSFSKISPAGDEPPETLDFRAMHGLPEKDTVRCVLCRCEISGRRKVELLCSHCFQRQRRRERKSSKQSSPP